MFDKTIYFILVVIIALAVLFLLGQLFNYFVKSAVVEPFVEARNEALGIKNGKPSMQLGSGKWQVEIADNAWSRAQGLSDRKSLPENRGMAFLFDQPEIHSFWMKGMNFPLDIVWIKSTGKRNGVVVGVSENLPPLKISRPEYYKPPQPADVVLELNAGSAKKWGIGKGSGVKAFNFDLR